MNSSLELVLTQFHYLFLLWGVVTQILRAKLSLQLARIWRPASVPRQNNSPTCADLATSECFAPKRVETYLRGTQFWAIIPTEFSSWLDTKSSPIIWDNAPAKNSDVPATSDALPPHDKLRCHPQLPYTIHKPHPITNNNNQFHDLSFLSTSTLYSILTTIHWTITNLGLPL